MKQGFSPIVVAALRAIALAAAAAAVAAAIAAASSAGTAAWWLPVVVLGLRQLEGVIDKARGQAPQQLGGSGPADPGA